MRRRPFGDSGLHVTELCLGTMTIGGQADEASSRAILDGAYEAGIRFVDTADVYPAPFTFDTVGRTEQVIGRWMRERGNRDDVVIATKGYFPTGPLPTERGNSRRHLTEACEASLRRLGTDHVEVYLCHGWDETVPIDETLRALDDLKQAGKILHPGLCNVRAHELAQAVVEAVRLGTGGFEGLQHRYSVILREAEESLFPVALAFGLGIMVYNPLAGGLLTGKYPPGSQPVAGTRFTLGSSGTTYRDRYWSDTNLESAQRVARASSEYGLSPVTASVAWALRHPAVSTVIIGVSRLDQLDDNLRGSERALPTELSEELDAVWYATPRTAPTLDTPRIASEA